MQIDQANGSQAVSVATWEPESPFLSDIPPAFGPVTASATAARRAFAPAREFESPFIAEYTGEDRGAGPLAESFAALMGELYDSEFEEALEDIVNEAAAVVEEQAQYEVGDPVRHRMNAERAVRDYLDPLARAAEATLDRIEAGLAGRDASQWSASEVDSFFEQFGAVESGLSPSFENFLGGVLKKAKSLSSIVMPQQLLLGKLKQLVRPLLERVLKMAIDKLPTAVRPIAAQLAKKFLAHETAFDAREDEQVSLAAADPAVLQEELDAQLAGYALQGESFEQHAAVQMSLADQAVESPGALQELERSRVEFARRISQLEDGEDAAPVVEQFIPAILPALKMAISIIGRPKVVNALAGMVANLISKYVGKEQSVPLSRALVDTGLRLISLEAAHEASPAGYALALTVEDTVNRLAQTAPPVAWESEALLEAYTWEAFQQAAAAHFPDSLIRSELHEAAEASGAWLALPEPAPRKRYKKYSRIVDVTLAPQQAGSIKTFGGITLREFLKDRLGVDDTKPVKARVHLYEALPGTTMSLVAYHEKNVQGLGSPRRDAWALFHPLTSEAAGLLLNEPGLGKPAAPGTVARRSRLAVGQRFYYLEIPGARVRLAARRPQSRPAPAHSSHPHIALDFPGREIRVALFYSEAHAQEFATQLRKRLPVAALLSVLKSKHEAKLREALSGAAGRGLRVIHERVPPGVATVVEQALRLVGSQLAPTFMKWLLDAGRAELEARYDRFTASFENAAKAEADGVTVVLVFKAPPLLEHLRKLFAPGGLVHVPAVLAAIASRASTDYRLDVRPGLVQV